MKRYFSLHEDWSSILYNRRVISNREKQTYCIKLDGCDNWLCGQNMSKINPAHCYITKNDYFELEG